MARRGVSLLCVASLGLLAAGCYTWRAASSDRTIWDELPNDPRPELWIEGEPAFPVVFEGVYTAVGESEPSFDPKATRHYHRMLRQSHIFTEVRHANDAAETPAGLARVRMLRSFREDDHSAANLAKAATVPGLLGYRFQLSATFRLELERPDDAPVTYEARSVLTCVYHHADNWGAARTNAYRQAERANAEAILHQLRADPDVVRALLPL